MKIRRSECPLFLAVALFLLGPWLRPAAAQLLGPEFKVNSYTTSLQKSPVVAATGSGNFVVVWQSYDQDGSDVGVFGQRFNSAGSRLGIEFQVNTYTTSYQSSPSVAANGSGNFVVVWAGVGQTDNNAVFGQRYNSAGSPLGSEFQVNTYTTSYQSSPSVAADGSGNFVVVWDSYLQDGSSSGIFGQRFASAGGPLGSEFQVNTYATGSQADPAVAAFGSGSFVVIWASNGQDGSDRGVFGQRFNSAGSPSGSEFRVNTYTTGRQFYPAVAAYGPGNFVVSWASNGQDGSSLGVFGQRFSSAGVKVGSEFQANSHTTGSQDSPVVAANGLDNFVVAWESLDQDGSSEGVFGQRFNLAGSRLGSEFQVNRTTTGDQFGPAVAATGSGEFVVAWSSPEDGSNYGVFGQRLPAGTFFGDFEATPPFWSDTTATMCAGHCAPDGTPDGICYCDSLCLVNFDCCLDACNTCGECVFP